MPPVRAKAKQVPKPKASAKAAPKASTKDAVNTNAKAATQKPPEPAVIPKEVVVGSVVVKYNHYIKEFPIRDGELTFEDVDAEYCLSMAFSEKAKKTLYCENLEMDKYSEKDVWKGLEDGKIYIMQLDEDEEVEAAQPKTVYVASGSDPIANMRKDMNNDGFGGTDNASCSCIEGNPCAQPYNCKDWNNRFEIAKKNGWKGF
eukprot:GHVR01131669.1.p1 GENE.GHVR01131669.1~~GHVR01131669.1.p1  ORF type:complete len:202 (+),score=35.41 GHVR01131669.1:83-688(+)